jgi:hypothetical protein
MMRRVRLAVGLAVVAVLAAAGTARADRWVLLGERVVNDRLDHDTIAVTGARGDYEAIKLAVRGNPVHFLDVKVHYANGGTQDVSIRSVIPAGGESRVIDLRGGDRVINRVEFWYEANSIGRGRRARIRLFGRR